MSLSSNRILAVSIIALLSACSSESPTDPTSTSSQPDSQVQFHAYTGTGVSVGLAAATTGANAGTTSAESVPELALALAETESGPTEPGPIETGTDPEPARPLVVSEPEPAPEPAAAEEPEDSEGNSSSESANETANATDEPDAPAAVEPEAQVESTPQSLAETNVPPTPAPEPVTEPVVVSSGAQFPQSFPMLDLTLPSSDISRPGYRESTAGVIDDMLVTRVSKAGEFGGNATHQYSKRSAFNINESLIEIGDSIVDRESLAIINPYVPVSSERVWSNKQPDLIYGIRYEPDPNAFASVNVRSNDHTIHRKFSDYNRCSLGNSEGNLSNDDGRVVLACDARSNGQRTLISYDIKEDRVLGTLAAEDNYNWAGFSQSGEYIVVENNNYPDPSPHIIVYDRFFKAPRHLGSPGHGDFGYDDNGDEVYVMIRWDVIWYVRLRDGARVDLSISNEDNPIGHGHISCRNLDRPGWCYFSAHKDSRLGAIRVSAENSVIEHWGFHRSSSGSYASEPKASVSRSGTRMVYTSDWFSETDVSDYMLEPQ